MIAWVYERAARAAVFDRLLIATDSAEILDYCSRNGIPARRTSSGHRSGTDRLVEVMEQDCSSDQAANIYLNIQGDEPMVTPEHIRLLLSPLVVQGARHKTTDYEAAPGKAGRVFSGNVQISTLKVVLATECAGDPNVVKVVTDCHGRAVYFSRAAIPFNRGDSGEVRYFKHLGFYAYTLEALRKFGSLPASALERTECLEQLRFLENDVPIHVLETSEDTIGVDTEEDLKRVQELFNELASVGAR